MRRYSKRMREQAAMICAIAASGNMTPMYNEISSCIGASKMAYRLACKAYRAVYRSPHWIYDIWSQENTCIMDAEAEALLRTGWTPD